MWVCGRGRYRRRRAWPGAACGQAWLRYRLHWPADGGPCNAAQQGDIRLVWLRVLPWHVSRSAWRSDRLDAFAPGWTRRERKPDRTALARRYSTNREALTDAAILRSERSADCRHRQVDSLRTPARAIQRADGCGYCRRYSRRQNLFPADLQHLP